MNRLRFWGLALAAMAVGLMIAGPIEAGCRARRVVHRQVVKQVVQKQVVAIAEVPVIAVYAAVQPLYSVSYAGYQQPPPPPPQAPQAKPEQSPDIKDLIQEIARLRAELEAAKKAQAPTLPKVSPEPKPEPKKQDVDPEPERVSIKKAGPPLALFKAKCSACHDQKNAGALGGDFVLLKGDQLAQLTDRQLLRIGSKTHLDQMPKVPNRFGITALSDEEAGSIQEWLGSIGG